MPLINQVQAVQTTGIAAAAKRKNSMIADANKRIAFLKGDGSNNYEEFDNCSFGRQYYDDSTEPNNPDQARVFVAISRKCKNPTLVVKFSLDKDANYIPRLEYTQSIVGHKYGKLTFPYPALGPNTKFWYNPSVICS